MFHAGMNVARIAEFKYVSRKTFKFQNKIYIEYFFTE